MPGLDGFGAAEKIRAVDADAVLVFVTNMAQYAIKGYEVDALDYVLKPVNYYQFCTKLSRAVQRVQRRRGGQVVLQLAGGGMQVLSTGDIYYLETHDRLLWYHDHPRVTFSVRAMPCQRRKDAQTHRADSAQPQRPAHRNALRDAVCQRCSYHTEVNAAGVKRSVCCFMTAVFPSPAFARY